MRKQRKERGDRKMIIKKEHKHNYTCVSNEILQRNDLSMQAKGLLVYLLSLPEDWEVHKSEIWKHFRNGRDAVYRAFEELERKGYITGKKYRDKKGRFRVEYTVYEEPNITETEPDLRNRNGKTAAVFQEVINKYKQSIYIKEEKKDFFKKEEPKPKESTQKEEKSIEEEIKKIETQIASAPAWLQRHLIELKRKKESQKQQ